MAQRVAVVECRLVQSDNRLSYLRFSDLAAHWKRVHELARCGFGDLVFATARNCRTNFAECAVFCCATSIFWESGRSQVF
jgi:hypothetical protein